jgi:signal transduction histidine kinase
VRARLRRPTLQKAESVLERGFRGSAARTRAPQGQGLGLHITHQVAQWHGWTLTLAASEYGGLEVSFAGDSLPESEAGRT